jgi:hypothetical protein
MHQLQKKKTDLGILTKTSETQNCIPDRRLGCHGQYNQTCISTVSSIKRRNVAHNLAMENP